MSRKHSELVSLGYLVAAIMILFPIVDLGANLWPFRPTELNWRYGTYGVMSGYLLTVVLGFGLVVAVGVLAMHRGWVRLLGGLSAVGGVLLLVFAAVYVLDALQIRATLSGDALGQFHIGTVKTLFKNGISGLALIWIAWAGWRGSAAAKGGTQKRTKEKPLVSGVS
jgi:hypothetical protein